jgi:PAS domain S-box-containing protein
MKKHILSVVEDTGLSGLIHKKLAGSPYKIFRARSWGQALGILRKNSIDLALLDINILAKQTQAALSPDVQQLPLLLVAGKKEEERAIELAQSIDRDYLLVDSESPSALTDKIKLLVKEADAELKYQQSIHALKESEHKMKDLLDTMKDPVYICSDKHLIQYSNSALKTLLGKRIHETKCYSAVFDSSEECQHCPSFGSLADEATTNQVEINVEGQTRFFKVSISPISFQNGSISRLHLLKDVTELIQARDHAANNERKIKLVADNSIDMVWQMDLRLTFTYLSPSAEVILGYKMDEMIGHKLWEFSKRKEFVKMARYAIAAVRDYRNFSVITFETRLLHKDGGEIPVEITGKLLKNESGKAIGLQGSTRDITERLEAQSEQAKQHALLRTLIDNIPDIIYAKDLSGRYILNNTAHQKELRVSGQEEILNKTDRDYYDPDAASEFFRDEQKIIDSGIPMINKEEFKAFKDGSNSWTLTTKVPIRDEKGKITGIAGINRDITDRKAIEDELFRSRYELALRNKIANIFLTSETEQLFQDVLQIILDEFQSSVGYFGYMDELRALVCPNKSGTPWVFPAESWKGAWGKSLQQKKSIYSNQPQELPIGNLPIQGILCVPVSIKGELLGQICLGNKPGGYNEKDQQILESLAIYIAPILYSYLKEQRMQLAKEEAFYQLKNAKEKAEESDKLKSAFLLNLSHELRTPLNALIGFTNVMAEKNRSLNENEFYVDQINSAGNDLMKMIEDTIEMAKIESGQIELDPIKQNMGTTLRKLESEFLLRYKKRFPEIEFQLDDQTQGTIIDTDHEKLMAALNNILDNAVKFSGNKGKVTLGGSINGNSLLVYVKDSGIGIPKELHAAVFEKFRKIESNEILHRGNGLGLSISKGLVEKLGGTIQIDPQTERGTTVRVSLPL